jgi:hypothetical protein
MTVLYSLFGTLLFIGLVTSGLLLMVAPSWGRALLKNTAAFASLFLIGIMLLQTCCAMLSRSHG